MGKTQSQNEKLTAALTAAGENLTAKTAEANASVAQAATDYVDAHNALGGGYQMETSGLIKSNGGFEVADEEQVKAAIAAIQAGAKAAVEPLKALLPKAGRKATSQKPNVSRLVWSKTKEPVMAEDTNLGSWTGRGIKQLRGEAYRESIGDRLTETCVIDIATGEVLTEGKDLVFAAAPGRKAQG